MEAAQCRQLQDGSIQPQLGSTFLRVPFPHWLKGKPMAKTTTMLRVTNLAHVYTYKYIYIYMLYIFLQNTHTHTHTNQKKTTWGEAFSVCSANGTDSAGFVSKDGAQEGKLGVVSGKAGGRVCQAYLQLLSGSSTLSERETLVAQAQPGNYKNILDHFLPGTRNGQANPPGRSDSRPLVQKPWAKKNEGPSLSWNHVKTNSS